MYGLLRKSSKLQLEVDSQLVLFDSLVASVLLYGCEVWGYENNMEIEKVQNKFFKTILHLNSSTSSVMLYGELGRTPLEVTIKTRMVTFWARLVNSKPTKLSTLLYHFVHYLVKWDNYQSHFHSAVESILNQCGMTYVWDAQTCDQLIIKHLVKQKLQDQYQQQWLDQVTNSGKCLTYRIIKPSLQFESYLTSLPRHLSISLCKFRLSNHRLPIEVGRHRNIDREYRICQLCSKNVLGDEFHALFECEAFKSERLKYIEKYYYVRPNTYKMEALFCSSNVQQLTRLAIFVKAVMYKYHDNAGISY
jgi:hypothetical protein